MKMRSAVPVLIAVLLASFWAHAQVKDFRPVTEAMLRNPAPGDWLNWRRTDNAWGYSPLDQINRQNVGAASARVVVGDGRHRARRRRRRSSTTASCTCRTRAASFRRWTRRPAI